MTTYMVEVGIELPKDDIRYDDCLVDLNIKKNWQALYDENILSFEDDKEAIRFIDDYVKNGVKGTYGFMWKIKHKLQDDDIYYDRSDVLYFKGGLK